MDSHMLKDFSLYYTVNKQGKIIHFSKSIININYWIMTKHNNAKQLSI